MALPTLSKPKGFLSCEVISGNSAPKPKKLLFWLKTGLISGQSSTNSKKSDCTSRTLSYKYLQPQMSSPSVAAGCVALTSPRAGTALKVTPQG